MNTYVVICVQMCYNPERAVLRGVHRWKMTRKYSYFMKKPAWPAELLYPREPRCVLPAWPGMKQTRWSRLSPWRQWKPCPHGMLISNGVLPNGMQPCCVKQAVCLVHIKSGKPGISLRMPNDRRTTAGRNGEMVENSEKRSCCKTQHDLLLQKISRSCWAA